MCACVFERETSSQKACLWIWDLARVCFGLIWGDGGEWGRRIEGIQAPGQWFPRRLETSVRLNVDGGGGYCLLLNMGFPSGLAVKNPPVMQETWAQSLGQEDPLEKEIATHSSILAWGISRTEEPGGLQSMGSHRAGHDIATKQQRLLKHRGNKG